MSDLLEHGYAVVTRDLAAEGLKAGDVGVVVRVHLGADGKAAGYMLETFTVDGESRDVVSVPADAVRATTSDDVATARSIAAE